MSYNTAISLTPLKSNFVLKIFIFLILFEKHFNINLYFAIKVVRIVLNVSDKYPIALR